MLCDVTWQRHLILNVKTTKEMTVDFRKARNKLNIIFINVEEGL